MEKSPGPAPMDSTKPSGIGPAQSTAKQSNCANSLPVVEDDDSDWEYEYSTTETETYYITLDLSTQDFTDKRTKTIHHGRGGYHSEKQANLFQSEQQDNTAIISNDEGDRGRSSVRKNEGDRSLPGLEARQPSSRRDSGEDDSNRQARRNEVQIMELHSANPVISYQGRVYAGAWHENVGTEFLITKHDEDSHLPVLRHLENGVDLLAASSARISVTQKELVRRDTTNTRDRYQRGGGVAGTQQRASNSNGDEDEDPIDETETLLVPPAEPGATQARIEQGNFLREFIALKRSRGETDAVPVLTNSDHLPKRAPSKRIKTPGRGQGAGGGRPRGVRAGTPRSTTRGRGRIGRPPGPGRGRGRGRTSMSMLNLAADTNGDDAAERVGIDEEPASVAGDSNDHYLENLDPALSVPTPASWDIADNRTGTNDDVEMGDSTSNT